MSADHRLLLTEAALLYEKHEADRPKPFNVFSVLCKESDEVNLHSRFLHALLDYKKPRHETRENLTDFLQRVGVQDFEQRDVKVKREHNYIDILVTNGAGQAVVVENKIWAGDQPEQLQRYHAVLKEQGYDKIHLLYLTPHGDDPSEDSAGDLPYETISYKDDLPPWLEGCQQRAYDEPGLRESVAQYLQLVRKLTDTDLGRVYMNELKQLCLESDNLVLVHDLNEAMIEAKVELLQRLWNEIDAVLRAEIPDLPPKDKDDGNSDTSYERIKRFVTARRNYKWHGLYYLFSKNAQLGIEVGNALFFGVRCHKKHQDERAKLEDALRNVGNNKWSNNWWPWCSSANGADLNLKHPTRENLELLSNDDRRKEYAQGVAQDLKPVWEAVKKAGLAGQNP